ncbi:hypothetical protein M378DRAFT_11744 [Amanita muscaria Koide BX008]|uniref:Uncharacterized protein n=1 Tax=Amanita muscaria (strain Koide BX008) TaxID=946122 RepID=A0A0C2SLF5_AMAMK|nr:hypothetical protein M378DRAFT_11744 [Amanita muscaria Koide BX008]
MSQTSNIISPCSRLMNDDVLREIFIHCIIHGGNSYTDYYCKNISTCFAVATYPSFLDSHKPSIRKYPQLSVSHVCSSWRDIALLTPQLWDNIRIADLTEANLSTAREYLSRAKSLPVSIKITSQTAELTGEDWSSQVTDFLSSYRIRTLDLMVIADMPRFHLVPVALDHLSQRSVAALESLRISRHSDRGEAQIDLNDTRYPKPAVVRIWGAYSSLRVFDGRMSSMTVIETWDLLSCCPSLEEARLLITPVNGSWRPVSIPQIHLQRLRILDLDSLSDSELYPFSTFIDALSLPVLEELRLDEKAVAWSATAFRSFAHRSNHFPRLRQFYMADSTSIVDAGILLALMPWLKSIYLCPRATTNKVIFDDLALDGLANGSLTPQLQSLRVGYISNTGSFLNMVGSRTKNAQVSSNGVPALFTKVMFSTFGYGYDNLLEYMQQRGIPVERLNI